MSASSIPGRRTSLVVRGFSLTTRDSNPSMPPAGKRGLLADELRKLLRAGFVQKAVPVEGVILMQRAWQGSGEDSAIVDSITIRTRDQARAERQGDGIPTWGRCEARGRISWLRSWRCHHLTSS